MEDKFKKLLLIWVLFISLIRLIALGYQDLQPWDEGLYALRSKAVVEFNAIWDQTQYSVDGLYSAGHPPLIIWLTALAYNLFGVNEFTARLCSALLGSLTIILIFYIVSKMVSYQAGAFAAIILGSNTFFTEYSRFGQLDVPYVFFMTLAILGWYLWHTKKSTSLGLTIISIAFGCALMSKIIVGFYIPLILIGVQLTIHRFNFKEVFQKDLVRSMIIGALVALPWHMWMAFRYGQQFFDSFFWFHLVQRTIEAIEGEGKILGLFYFINQLFVRFPELVFGFAGIILAVFKFKTLNIKNEKIAIPFVWMAVVIIIITVIETKVNKYILPIAIPAAILGSVGLNMIFDKGTNKKAAFFIALAGSAAILWANFYPLRSLLKESILGIAETNPYQFNSIIPYLWIGFSMIGPFLLIISNNKYAIIIFRNIFVVAFLVIATVSCIQQVCIESLTKYNLGTKQVCTIIKNSIYDELVLVSDVKNPAISFYLDGIEEGWYNDKRFFFLKAELDEETVKKALESQSKDKNRFIIFDKRELARVKKFQVEKALPLGEYKLVFINEHYSLYYGSN